MNGPFLLSVSADVGALLCPLRWYSQDRWLRNCLFSHPFFWPHLKLSGNGRLTTTLGCSILTSSFFTCTVNRWRLRFGLLDKIFPQPGNVHLLLVPSSPATPASSLMCASFGSPFVGTPLATKRALAWDGRWWRNWWLIRLHSNVNFLSQPTILHSNWASFWFGLQWRL